MDDIAQGRAFLGGARGLIYSSEYACHSFAVGLGDHTNNYEEFVVVRLLLSSALYMGINQLQVFGDLMLVINCLSKVKAPRNIHRLPLFEAIQRSCLLFQQIKFSHIYREMNKEADILFKLGLCILVGY